MIDDGIPNPEICTLCGAFAEIVGMFEPSLTIMLAMATRGYPLPQPGKQRTILYGLCDTCKRSLGAVDRVEECIREGRE